ERSARISYHPAVRELLKSLSRISEIRMKQVQHMGLGGYARLQRHFHGAEHGLFIVMQDQ
ncbi:MAG: hypothetical protein JJU24_15425, partial [Natronohydrobacter sp.]|nr:hypothetical protein [Natronohydrobacter sp.]